MARVNAGKAANKAVDKYISAQVKANVAPESKFSLYMGKAEKAVDKVDRAHGSNRSVLSVLKQVEKRTSQSAKARGMATNPHSPKALKNIAAQLEANKSQGKMVEETTLDHAVLNRNLGKQFN